MTYKPVAITGRLLSVLGARCKALRVGRENALNRRGDDRSLHVGQFTSLGCWWRRTGLPGYTRILCPPTRWRLRVRRQSNASLCWKLLGAREPANRAFHSVPIQRCLRSGLCQKVPTAKRGGPFNTFPAKAITSSHPASDRSYVHGQRPSGRPSKANDKNPPDIPTGLCLFRLRCEVRSS